MDLQAVQAGHQSENMPAYCRESRLTLYEVNIQGRTWSINILLFHFCYNNQLTGNLWRFNPQNSRYQIKGSQKGINHLPSINRHMAPSYIPSWSWWFTYILSHMQCIWANTCVLKWNTYYLKHIHFICSFLISWLFSGNSCYLLSNSSMSYAYHSLGKPHPCNDLHQC